MFLLIALLALVLNGPVPAGAAGRPGPVVAGCDADACPGGSCRDDDEDLAEARPLDALQASRWATGARRCHSGGRPLAVPVAMAPRLPAFEPGVPGPAGPGPEPAPWPGLLAQAGFPWGLGPHRGPGRAVLTTLPEGFPGVLARSCVLRI